MKQSHIPTQAERAQLSAIVQSRPRPVRRYPCPICGRRGRLNLKQYTAGYPCDSCVTVK